MQDFNNYCDIIFHADPETNYDYQLCWALYKKWSTYSIGLNDILIIQNALLNSSKEIDKKSLTDNINKKTEIQLEIEKLYYSLNNK